MFAHVCGAGNCGNVPERMTGVGEGVHKDHGGNMRKSVSLLLSHTCTHRGLWVVTGFGLTIRQFSFFICQ